MRCSEIIQILEKYYPEEYACSWDHVGIQAGRLEKEITRVFVALDVTKKVIKEAVAKDADMVITHHPLLFKPIYSINNADPRGAKLIALLQHDICCYSAHTNYDILGMADLAAGMLGLKEMEPVEPSEVGGDPAVGIGRVGALPFPRSLESCAELVKETFGLPSVTVYGTLLETISRAAIVPGSGRSMIDEAKAAGAQVLITGDIGHHEGLDAMAEGLAVIDAGHYGLEKIFVSDMTRFLSRNVPDIVVFGEETAFPYHII